MKRYNNYQKDTSRYRSILAVGESLQERQIREEALKPENLLKLINENTARIERLTEILKKYLEDASE